MKRKRKPISQAQARRWGKELAALHDRNIRLQSGWTPAVHVLDFEASAGIVATVRTAGLLGHLVTVRVKPGTTDRLELHAYPNA